MPDIDYPVNTGQLKTLRELPEGSKFAEQVIAMGVIANPQASLTIVGGTYSVGDLIANSTTAGSVAHPTLTVARVPGGSWMLRRLRVRKVSTATGGSIRVHVFRSAPVVSTTGDNGVLASVVAGRAAERLGSFDVTFDQAWSDGAEGVGVPNVGSDVCADLADGVSTVHLVVEARSTTFGVGDVFTFIGEVLQN